MVDIRIEIDILAHNILHVGRCDEVSLSKSENLQNECGRTLVYKINFKICHNNSVDEVRFLAPVN